ncbi:MAG: ankyrin repeat domain-containing protein [Pusillimonas sp.]
MADLKSGFSRSPVLRTGIATLALVFSTSVAAVSPNWWVDIANDRTEKVKTELALGEDPNVKTANGQPAIMQAIQDQAWGVYDLLASHRALNVNITNQNGETPLMYLAIVGDLTRAKALVARGAEINRLGWTPLHYAASKGQLEMVRYLLANKALVDAPAPDGTTPLMMAAFSGNDDTVRALLAAGAEVTTQNLSKLDAADWARNKNFSSLADRLQKLIKDTVAQRNAARSRNAAQAAVPAAVDLITGNEAASAMTGTDSRPMPSQMDGNQTPMPPTLLNPPSVLPVEGRPQLSTDPAQPGESEGTSRYFDLDRFK